MKRSVRRAMRRSTWIVVAGIAAALLLIGGVGLPEAVSVGDAELVSGEDVPAAEGNEATARAASLPESASTEGLDCGYVECEVELIVTKTARSSTKGAPGGLMIYDIHVDVPSGSPGPVIIDSVVDDVFGDLSSFDCDLIGHQLDPGDDDDCEFEIVLDDLEVGDAHTNTVTVKGHVVGTDIPAAGQDSETVDIAEQQLATGATYTVANSFFDCVTGLGSASITVTAGTVVWHCPRATNAGNTVVVSYQATFLGATGSPVVADSYPGRRLETRSPSVAAPAGTTVYTFVFTATDEWGTTLTDTIDVTVIGE